MEAGVANDGGQTTGDAHSQQLAVPRQRVVTSRQISGTEGATDGNLAAVGVPEVLETAGEGWGSFLDGGLQHHLAQHHFCLLLFLSCWAPDCRVCGLELCD